jgi:N,N'-diacetylchitobiose phosphorylase
METATVPIAAPSEYGAVLLSNGCYSVLVSRRGGGYSGLDGLALTRWAPDPTLDADGFCIYLRDVDTGAFWRAAAPSADVDGFSHDGSRVRFTTVADRIESELEVVVAASLDAELRRLALKNTGATARRIEITTLAELALNTPGADAAHPAFSKLFIQTEHIAASGALLAWRRLRSPDDRPLFAAHALIGGGSSPLQHETDRMRFIGRGRSRRAPAALTGHEPLSGTTGNVLDPVFCLRRTVVLQPGEAAVITAVLAAAADARSALSAVRHFAEDGAVAEAFSTALAALPGADRTLGLPERWRERIRLLPPLHDAPARRSAPAQQNALPAAAASRDAADRAPDASHGGTDRGALVQPGHPADGEQEVLQFFNGWGGFSPDGREYVILLPRQEAGAYRPPMPWVNVIANEEAGCIVSESGATFTWSGNSRENRLTPWFNDPVTDPHGEALYVRDDEDGTFWSPTPGPCPGDGDYVVRHGFGSTTFRHMSQELRQEVTVFVPADAPVRIARMRLSNASNRRRRVTICSYAQLVLGTHEADTRGSVETHFDAEARAIFAVQRQRGEYSDRIALAASAGDGILSWTTDRQEFLGSPGSVEAPAGLAAAALGARAGVDLDPCAVLARSCVLEPGTSVTCAFLLGEADGEPGAREIVTRFADMVAIDDALAAAAAAWTGRLGTVHVSTPSPAIDLMVNGWLAYQNLSCRMWARSAYYQSGGAYGFRDQLQDSSALLYMDPAITRRQILLHAAHQFVEGDVLHWWHPPLSKGIRTRFSDDLLWLPYITAFYIGRTGDTAILNEDVPYLRAQQLAAGEDERFVMPEDAGVSASLYEHCCRAVDRSLKTGAHGLPLMGAGDWNDGMNRVGRAGRGESVWLGFFLYDILRDFGAIAGDRGDAARRDTYAAHREQLRVALNDGGWDGAWYRRAYYDNGEPLGSADGDECRIDALAQAWAVISGAAPRERAVQALDAIEQHLVSEDDGLIRLLAPAFDTTANDPGYIRGYLPGVRENGGQYTHGVLWTVRALAELGRSERAAALLELLTPVWHGGTPERAARYRVEPYVMAADVYAVEPHVGRGGWTWYTGSAGWMLRVALESVLGIELRGGVALALRPCIPSSWPGYRVRLRLSGATTYTLHVTRTGGPSAVVADGGELPDCCHAEDGVLLIPLVLDGAEHSVSVALGSDIGPRYTPR